MYKILDSINSPDDIKNLSYEELNILSSEIREYLVDTISQSGGHLSSNLGVVELTIAMHRVLNLPEDKIIWDVGHQSYVHKILTGRKDKLGTIRTLNGISGFTCPSESEYDFVSSGHSSTALSTAVGIATARDLLKEKYDVAAVVGDGALAGGLSFEALDHIGQSKRKMLIVLNDNEMSISKNVGGLSKYLTRTRTSLRYAKSKKGILNVLDKMPKAGDSIMRALKTVKNHVKYLVSPGVWFEEMGITYLGPVDGHNIESLEDVLKRACSLNEPTVVHVITKKGKGYKFAEQNPENFHGVSSFDKQSGKIKNGNTSFSDIFGKKIIDLAKENEKIVAITPSMTLGSGLSDFAKKNPNRFFDVGIAEGHAVTFASGLATRGIIPVVSVYSSFLQRAYDNVFHDCAIDNKHIVFAIDRAGFVPCDGPTHQGLFDISFMSHIPNMTILAPSCFLELEKMLDYAINVHNAPIAIRYPRGSEKISLDNGEFTLGKAAKVCEGENITIAAEGEMVAMAMDIAQELLKKGISSDVLDMRTIKPIDIESIRKSVEKTHLLLTLESNMEKGGMGEQIVYMLKKYNLEYKSIVKAVKDEFAPHASESDLLEFYGLDKNSILQEIEKEWAVK